MRKTELGKKSGNAIFLIKNRPRFFYFTCAVRAQGCQPPLKIFSKRLTSRLGRRGRGLKLLVNGFYISDLYQYPRKSGDRRFWTKRLKNDIFVQICHDKRTKLFLQLVESP